MDDELGIEISWSGLEKSAVRLAACDAVGVWRARFLSGRLLRGSAEVGILSGIGSDIF